ncbi:MAG: c-type cytochrome [Acidobacteriaceae bacterium]|nr:c-type cytochrome [Acidobacteriaceae bacterium]MBV9779777.1 c-type cytochrome [Acidobacteriaceae bacterium]
MPMAAARGVRKEYSFAAIALVGFLSLTACGKPTERPIMPPDVTDFKTLFSENCAGCHGMDGKNGPVRPLNDPLYLTLIPRETLEHTIENGVPGTAMPAWARDQGGPLYPKQITALVDGIESNWTKSVTLGSTKLPSYDAGGDAGDAAHGKQIFVRSCFMCHGKGAKIGLVTDPSYLALVSDQNLRTSIIAGRSDLGMPDWRFLNLGHALTDQEISDIVAYLASLRPQGAQTATHVVESGSGQTGARTTGNEGSGNGPGSPENQTANQGSGGKGVGNARTKQ